MRKIITPDDPRDIAFGDGAFRPNLAEALDQEGVRERRCSVCYLILLLGAGAIVGLFWAAIIAAWLAPASAHWTGPTPAGAPDKQWWDALASGKGLCCSFADGVSIKDVDWDTGGPNNAYRVRLNGQWIVVPPDSVVNEPNRFGAAVVWPYQDADGKTQIRCFMPGAGA